MMTSAHHDPISTVAFIDSKNLIFEDFILKPPEILIPVEENDSVNHWRSPSSLDLALDQPIPGH
jgi:hypothetical protein